MVGYHRRQVAGQSEAEPIGPLLPGTGASGVVFHRGEPLAGWGAIHEPEMCYSLTKSVLSLVAGLAYDRGLIGDVHAPVELPVVGRRHGEVTWHHLLQQTSGWDGVLWGKPSSVDGANIEEAAPGSAWCYNDVRVNLLALALTLLWRRSLADVVKVELFDRIGVSRTWSWHGYDNSFVEVDGRDIAVVSGGAHWGGGLWASAADLARLGVLLCERGRWHGDQILSDQWIRMSWAPGSVNPDYGYLWWLNRRRNVFPAAPATGVCARGNQSRHVLWIDRARELVIVSHWGEHVEALIGEISAAVPVVRR
ncbi:class C beta-lactamase-related serine hydrolase [Amycolatopsis suaedae]|uniref:Class C beta-lactamase-related serine hydrolase n=2 Tax=Amycolatopsis suaedae TaxID=2510978 RepID=A0A4Q7JCZ1_9PSEU|nr:class C beta-lactamase-related serine hydrolase [Amycolatopsis suaedae]